MRMYTVNGTWCAQEYSRDLFLFRNGLRGNRVAVARWLKRWRARGMQVRRVQ